MDKTININLGGSLFKIDEEAFTVLRDYIQAINSRFRNVQGGLETIEDIESRIAEIFLSRKGLAGVISRQNVEEMIRIIGKPGDFDTIEGESEKTDYSSSAPKSKRIFRSADDKVVSGVCGGLGAYLNTDPVLFRVLFVIFTLFGGIGLLIYLVLWIAVPLADSEPKRREMYGENYNTARSRYRNSDGNPGIAYSQTASGSGFNSGLNEVLNAFGKVFFVIFRIFMIGIGIIFVITGFLAFLSFVMIFIIKYPGAFSGFDFNVMYLPELLKHIVTPAVVPWILILTSIVFLLPMIALIYWGIRMIFWFKVRDGIFSLTALIVWVVAVAALSIILFNEGVSFAESSSTTSQNIMPKAPQTLHIVAGNKLDDLDYQNALSIPDEEISLFVIDPASNILSRPKLRLHLSEDNSMKVEVRKRSSGRTRSAASEKSESLVYNYRISSDTLYLDDYFKIPAGTKWSADFVSINLCLPEKTVLTIDRPISKLFHDHIEISRVENEDVHTRIDCNNEPSDLPGKFWVLDEDGLEELKK